MKIADFHDTLTVRKGPEDGSEFAITSSPVYIGTDSTCLVQIQFDVTVRPIHARASASRNGYVIRSAEGAPVYVNGRQAGIVRSRRLRPGEVVKVGHTELVLQCATDGLTASASGSWTESDLRWAARSFTMKLLSIVRLVKSLARKILKFALAKWKIAAIVILILAYALIAPLRAFIYEKFNYVRDVLEI